MPVVNHSRADVSFEPLGAPDPAAFADIAAAAGLERDGRASTHVAAHRYQGRLAPERRRIDSSAQSFTEPKLFAGPGIETDQSIREVHDYFLMPAGFYQQRCAP